jgi:two-component system copper resistance phosphate regulon response regulator CusR
MWCKLVVRRKAMRILVVDDDRRLCGIIKRGLLEEACTIDVAYDAEEAEYLTEVNLYDLIILDIMMPRKDGVQVYREPRAKRVNTLVLMLMARDAVEDRVKGLDAGVDDYLIKPFVHLFVLC